MNPPIIPILLEYSVAKEWYEAQYEWSLIDVWESDTEYECACGHEIREVCVIENSANGKVLEIGNCCVRQIPGDKFNPYKKVLDAKKQKRVNDSMIIMAYEKGIINEWEYKFMLKLWRKRKLTEKQSKHFGFIRNRILYKLF